MNATPLRAALLAAIVLLGGAGAARAENFTVTTTANAGAGSLRDAIEDANAATDVSNTITFDLPDNSTISLATPLDPIDSETLVLDATQSSGLTIDGTGATPFLTNAGATTSVLLRNISYTDATLDFAFDQLTLDGANDVTLDGDLNGTDFGNDFLLLKTGTGTATLPAGAAITLTPFFGTTEARIEQGGLVVDGDLSADEVVANSGTTLVVNGTITAANSVVVNATTLDMNGAITGTSVLIGPSTLFTGTAGSITATTTALQGMVSPSTTTGTLSIDGDVSFASSSVFEVDLAPGPINDRITVTNGSVTVAPGARLEIRADAAAIVDAGTQVFTLIDSPNPVTGVFTLGVDYAFLDESFAGCGADDVCLTLAPNGLTLADFAFTPNQQAVASQIDAASAGATGDLADAIDAINQSSAAEMPELLDSLGGETLTSFATGRQILAERTARALHRRTRDGVWGEARAFYLPPIEKPSLLDELFHAGAWLDAFGLYGELDGERGEAEVDTVLGGGTLGVDAWLGESLVGGLAAGYARIDLDAEDRNAQAYGDAIQGALYAGFTDPRGYVSVYGRYAYTFQDSSRRISSSGLHRSAHASWEAQDFGAGAEAGLTILSLGGVGLQPIAGIDWLRLDEESYRERSAGSLGLDVDPEVLDSTTARFGGRLFGRVVMGNLGVLVPELRAFWQREYGDRDRVLNARLIGAPQVGPSGVRGAELPSEVLILGAGWGVHIGNNLTVTLDYDALLDSDRVEHQGNIAARWLF